MNKHLKNENTIFRSANNQTCHGSRTGTVQGFVGAKAANVARNKEGYGGFGSRARMNLHAFYIFVRHMFCLAFRMHFCILFVIYWLPSGFDFCFCSQYV